MTYPPNWIPPKEIFLHSNDPIPSDMEFFVHPPIEIGKLLSAFSDLKLNQKESLSLWQIFLCFLSGLGASLLGLVLFFILEAN
jgi:hypothetical protein